MVTQSKLCESAGYLCGITGKGLTTFGLSQDVIDLSVGVCSHAFSRGLTNGRKDKRCLSKHDREAKIAECRKTLGLK